MDKNIFEEGPRRGHAAGDTSLEQQASQLASDIKYKARQKMKGTSGSNMSPGQVQQLYRQLLNSSPAPGGVKAIVKKKLFGEQVDPGVIPVAENVASSKSDVFGRVFVEGGGQKEEVIEEEDQKFVVRVTDKATGNTSYRKADRAKIAELRANKNISSVEITGRKKADDAYGDKKAKRDYDGDGKVESGSKEHAGVVHNAIQRKKGGVADGQDTRKEEYVDEALTGERAKKALKKPGGTAYTRKVSADPAKRATRGGRGGESDFGAGDRGAGNKAARRAGTYQEEVIYEKEDDNNKKLDVMKGKNKVNTSPTIGESIRAELDALKAQKVEEAAAAAKAAGPSPEERQQLMNKDKMLKKKIMMQKQTMQMQKQGRLPLNYSEEADAVRYCPKCDKDETRDECRYGGEYWDENSKPAKAEDPRGMKTSINLAKNKLRAMGLKMSYDMEGESIDEVVGAVAGVAKVGALAAKGVAKAAPVVAKGVVKGAKVAGKAISKGAKIANRSGKKVKKAVDTADKATDVALKMQELERREKQNQAEAKDPFADKPYDKFGRSKDPKARKKAQEKASTLRSSDRRSGRNTYGSRLGYDKKEWDESVNHVEESAEDRLRDQRMERGGVGGNQRYDRAPKAPNTKKFGTGKTMAQKEMEKKYGKGATAMDIVKAQIRAKHGKGSIK